MKSFLALFALLFSVSALAQKHMVEFNANSILLGQFAFNLEKDRDEQNAEEVKSAFIYLNYAYLITERIQLGARAQYASYKGEDYNSKINSLTLGAIFNLDTKVTESFYASIYTGFDWEKYEYSGSDTDRDEEILAIISLGKRFPLSFLKLENVTFSPEISFQTSSSTQSDSTVDWSQELAIKYLQFSIFF